MRIALLIATFLFATPAMAQFWGHYENQVLRYAIDVPPGFEGNGETADGKGQIFYNVDAEQGVTVWGNDFHGDFADAVTGAAAAVRGEGWAITEQSSTPKWAALAAVRDDRFIYQRMIILCDNESFAAFRVEFNTRDLNIIEPVLSGLARSFVPVGC